MNSLGKREGRHKKIQVVSPFILLAKGEERHKRIQAVSPFILLAKVRKDSTLLFSAEFSLAEKQGLEKQNLESVLEKEEQEER